MMTITTFRIIYDKPLLSSKAFLRSLFSSEDFRDNGKKSSSEEFHAFIEIVESPYMR